MGLVYWMILLTANSLLLTSGFPGLNTAEQSKIAACLPDQIKEFGPNISGSCNVGTDTNSTVNVASSSDDLIPVSTGLLASLASIITGIAGQAASTVLQLVPGATTIANFISNFLFGYLAFFNYLAITFVDFGMVLFIVGGIIFSIQLMCGFYFILAILSALTGGSV